MTSHWDSFALAWSQLSGDDVPQGRKQDMYQVIRTLIDELHNLDHATDHKSTIQLFKSKSLQLALKAIDCDHYKDADKFQPTKEKDIFECSKCEKSYHKDFIKEYYGLEVKHD